MAFETRELDWLAFRYVAGELAGDDEARFERRLADDQAAREAVEEAVALQESVRLAIAEMPATRPVPATPKRHRGITMVGSAVCLLLAGGLFWIAQNVVGQRERPQRNAVKPGPATPASRSGGNDFRETDAVARVWARLRVEQRRAPMEMEADSREWPEESVDSTSETGVREQAGVPRWLLTAVSTSAGKQENK